MGKLIDRTGRRYGMLVVLRRDGAKPLATNGRRVFWVCRCDCGSTKSVTGHDLQAGHTSSCGCAHHKLISERRRRHGHARKAGPGPSRTYYSWQAAKARCHDKHHSKFAEYGARGIEVCERWRDSFENFLADMGERPVGKTLDRIDGTKGYSPHNCRWATPTEQTRNSSRTHIVQWAGKQMTLTEVARHECLPRTTLGKRYRALGDIGAAVSETHAKLRWPVAA